MPAARPWMVKNSCAAAENYLQYNLQECNLKAKAIIFTHKKKKKGIIMSHNQIRESSSRAGWQILKSSSLLIAGSYSGPEGLPSFLRLISLSTSASSFHESSEMVPPGRRGYQLMACPREKIRTAKLHPVLDVQWCSKSNSPGPRMAWFNKFQSVGPLYEYWQRGLLGGCLLGGRQEAGRDDCRGWLIGRSDGKAS